MAASMKGWVASHTGLPSFHLVGPGRLMADDRLVAVIPAGVERLVSDAGCEAGAVTVYRFVSQSVALRRVAGKHQLLTDSRGRTVAHIQVTGNDSRDRDPGASLFENDSEYPVVRYSRKAPSPSGTIEFLTSGTDTASVRELHGSRAPLWLIHNASACQISDCDLGGARLIQPTKLRETRTRRVDMASREWSVTYQEMEPDASAAAPVVTWGEYADLGLGYQPNWSLVELARRAANMPV